MNSFEFSQKDVVITDGQLELPGNLSVPTDCHGLVIFAHGSGSSRLSPRNLRVAHFLNQGGLATLLFDLLTLEESEDRGNVFNIPLLASRLVMATRWVRDQNIGKPLPLGYFGASTGGGAALCAAAELGREISAVVSRGGRPDLAIPYLKDVTSPTLLIVGGDDEPVIEMNRNAMEHLAHSKLVIIAGATHLFEEPGKLQMVAEQARQWFLDHFGLKAVGGRAA